MNVNLNEDWLNSTRQLFKENTFNNKSVCTTLKNSTQPGRLQLFTSESEWMNIKIKQGKCQDRNFYCKPHKISIDSCPQSNGRPERVNKILFQSEMPFQPFQNNLNFDLRRFLT